MARFSDVIWNLRLSWNVMNMCKFYRATYLREISLILFGFLSEIYSNTKKLFSLCRLYICMYVYMYIPTYVCHEKEIL